MSINVNEKEIVIFCSSYLYGDTVLLSFSQFEWVSWKRQGRYNIHGCRKCSRTWGKYLNISMS